MTMLNNKMILTHNENFNTGDVFSIALLGKLGFGLEDLDELLIIRSCDEKVINYHENHGGYIINVGRRYKLLKFQFDLQNNHNLKWDESDKLLNINYKECPFLYSSSGLIWNFLRENKSNIEVMKKLSDLQLMQIEYFVKWIDVCDNEIASWVYAPLFCSYNINGSKDSYEADKSFRLAVKEAGNFIQNLIDSGDVFDLYTIYKDDESDFYNVSEKLDSEINATVNLNNFNDETKEILKDLVLVKHIKMLKNYFNAFIIQYSLEDKKNDLKWKRKIDHTIEWSIRNFVSNMARAATNKMSQ